MFYVEISEGRQDQKQVCHGNVMSERVLMNV